MIAQRYRIAAVMVIGTMGLGAGAASALTPPVQVPAWVGNQGGSPPAAPAGAPVTAAEPASKDNCPSADAFKDANQQVLIVYKEQIAAAKLAAQKAELARKMLEAARDDRNAAERYALLSTARDYANEAVDIETLWNVMREFDRTFVVDGVKIHADMILLVNKNVRLPEQRRVLVRWLTSLVETSIAFDRYEVAQPMTDLYLSSARGLSDQVLQKEASATVLRVRELSGAYEVVRKSIEFLAAHPSDPEANFKVGRFRCFYKGDWKSGLPMLSIGSDKTLASLAELELKGTVIDEELVRLADGWWDAGATATGISKLVLENHAFTFYTTAYPRLAGLAKVKAEMRMKEVTAANPTVTAVGTTGGVVTGSRGPGGATGTTGTTGTTGATGAPGTAKSGVDPLAVAIDDQDIVTKILNKIPPQFLPSKDDADLDIRSKEGNLQTWLRTNKVVDPQVGLHFVLEGIYEDSSVMNVGNDRKGNASQRVTIRFTQELLYKGIPVRVNMAVMHSIQDQEAALYKQAKDFDKAGKGAGYTISTVLTSASIFLRKTPTGTEINVNLDSMESAMSQKGRGPRGGAQ